VKIPKNLLQHIITEAESMQYGEITILINETNNKIDVLTQRRMRFDVEKLIKQQLY